MFRYILTRIARAALTILLVMTFAFVVLRLSGDPAQILLGPDAPQDALEAFNADLEEVSEVAAKLPLDSGELVSQITIPVIERTNQCLALLRRIQLCLEAEKNA